MKHPSSYISLILLKYLEEQFGVNFLKQFEMPMFVTLQFFPWMFFCQDQSFQSGNVNGTQQTHGFFVIIRNTIVTSVCGCRCRIRQMEKVDMIPELPGHISFFRKKVEKSNLDVCCCCYMYLCSSETMGHLMYYRIMDIIRVLKKEIQIGFEQKGDL